MFDTQAPPCSAPAEHVEARALAQLRSGGYLELHNVDCTFADGTLTLEGRVSSYYLLQKAQALVRDVEGVQAIDNRIVVQAVRPRADR